MPEHLNKFIASALLSGIFRHQHRRCNVFSMAFLGIVTKTVCDIASKQGGLHSIFRQFRLISKHLH